MPSMPPPQKTQNYVMGIYRRMRHKSWPRVAKIIGVASGARARMIAYGQRPAPPNVVQQSIHHGIRNPRTLLKKIQRVAIPFLERQQSATHVYTKKGHRA